MTFEQFEMLIKIKHMLGVLGFMTIIGFAVVIWMLLKEDK